MKKGFVLQSLICLLAVSCSVHEIDTLNPIPDGDDIFYASFESYSEPDTKVHVDKDVKILWDEKDQISIFNKSTLNDKYEFQGETGDNSGFFKKVSAGTGTSTATNYVCAVYPYKKKTSLDDSGVLTLTIPEEQAYREESFGLEANVMVSTNKGKDNLLRFKNVGGYLVFKFFGQGADGSAISISSIKLEGRNGELLSGEATMTPVIDEIPIIEMAPTAGTSITLKCDKAVKLGKTENKATQFWMVVPPTSFSQGFKVTVTDKDGNVFIRESNTVLNIERNRVTRLGAFEVTADDFMNPNHAIYYSTLDNVAISLNENADFGANLVRNDYSEPNNMCVMVFDGDVTKIGNNAFENCETLTDIAIPGTVETIGDYAFAGCTSLGALNTPASTNSKAPAKTPARSGETTIVIPDGVTSIGAFSFKDCTSLTSISIPETVTSIGDGAFSGCENLSDIVIPSNVTEMGENVFDGCTSITSITIPDGVESIDDYAFAGCTNLTEVIIPETVKSIGQYAFYECSNLTSIEIPSTVTTIGHHAFDDCENLVNINIPNGVTRIEPFTFAACHALPGIYIPDGVTAIGSSAFDCCWVLEDITLPSSVTYIGNAAFASCHALTSFTIPPQVAYISDDLFSNCDHLSSVIIHEGVEFIEYGAFYHCSSLTEISIPESVTSIGENAFSESGLTNITIPQNVESIGNWAFRDCEQLTSFTILAVTPPVIDYAPATEGLFLNTNCPIYVQAESLTAYKEAEVWSNYASRIHTIPPASGEINGHAFVDLGTGLKWGTMNVGAASETEYGNLYAWGKTEPRVFDPNYVYDSSTAFVDVATSEWGQSWRYPTVQEWNAITNLSKFTWTWDSVNKGYWVESKIQGYEGHKIFLPAAGEFGEPENDNYFAGEEGCYWSSTIGDDSGTAWELHCWDVSGVIPEDPEEQVNFVETYFAGFNGGAGLSVRPVAD